MRDDRPHCWRCQRYDPERDHTSWDELRELLSAESALRLALERAASAGVPLLLSGPPGRGKRWIARSAHALSGRSGPLVEVEQTPSSNGAVPLRHALGELEEASLVLAGTDATSARTQRELADLVDREGGELLIALSDRAFPEAVGSGALCRELGDRLLGIEVGPLRDRPDDVDCGLRLFLDRESRRCGRTAPDLHEVARARLRSHRWPGDVAELERFAERALVLDSLERAIAMGEAGSDLGAGSEDLWADTCQRLREGEPIPLERVRRRIVRHTEEVWVDRVLDRARGDTARAAELLDVAPSRLGKREPRGTR